MEPSAICSKSHTEQPSAQRAAEEYVLVRPLQPRPLTSISRERLNRCPMSLWCHFSMARRVRLTATSLERRFVRMALPCQAHPAQWRLQGCA